MKDPAVAPAAPKHAIVENVGYVPRCIDVNKGINSEVPFEPICICVVLIFGKTENDIVLTRVTLNMGANTPRKKPRYPSVKIGMPNAIREVVVFVGLHSCFNGI